ncbi:MAG: hypothetical protein R3E50_10180 [Halioglobus sp.]
MLKLGKNKNASPDSGLKKEAVTNTPQGITAKGNTLRAIGSMALAATLVPVLLGFTYLILLREPDLQERQVERVASSFALQQATNVYQFYTRIKERVQSAAMSPLALSAIASASEDDIALVEKAMLDFFPEVVSLRIIPIGDMGTADFSEGNQGLRNHIEVDLVRRASEGEETQPEAYQFEDQWLTSMAARVTHPRIKEHWAVMVVTIDNKQLSRQLKSLGADSGRFALEQQYTTPGGQKKLDVIATSGDGPVGPNTRYADVPGTTWRISFSPSETLMATLHIDQVPLYAVLALIVIAALASLGIVLILFPRKLDAEVNLVISAADQKTPLTLGVPELVTIAKQLRRATLRALRQSNTSFSDIPRPEVETIDMPGPNLTNPLFQSKKMIDEDESLDLDLASGAPAARPPEGKSGQFPEHIFRAYDIRGNAQTELTDDLVANIAKAIATIAGEMGEQALIVGCDGRTSSPRIKSILVRSLMEAGRDVVDIGLVQPLLYFATRRRSWVRNH